MRSLRETHLKIHLLLSPFPPIFKKSGGHHTKVRLKKTACTKLKNWCCSSTMCWICVGFLWAIYSREALNE